MSSDSPKILFVCTGNVFRSMTAEWACRASNAAPLRYHFESAGIRAKMDGIAWPNVSAHLQTIKLDTSDHKPRQLNEALLRESDLIIAMNCDHQRLLKQTYGRVAPLFLEVAASRPYAMPDACDLFARERVDSPEARAHISRTIDRIVDNTGRFIERLPRYLR